MDRVKLYCCGECRGEIVLRPEGVRTEVEAVMEDPGDGLYRAALCGERGELALGVLAPEGPLLKLRRKLYSRDLAGLDGLLRGEARRSFRFQETGWRETSRPAQLVQESFLQSRMQELGLAWWRKERGLLYLAFPLDGGGPFPLETLFCLARVERVEGRPCAVYAFREDEPVLP